MNKRKYFNKFLLLIGVITILAASCKKYTELAPLASIPDVNAFNSPENIELAMKGVYQIAAVGNYNGSTAGRGYPFGAASILQAEMRGQDLVNLATFYQITYESTYDPATANNTNHWDQLYFLVNQANIVIEGVTDNSAISAEKSLQYQAEARFLRALSFHELVINFSRPFADKAGSNPGVPYRTVAVSTPAGIAENLSVNRGTVADVYTKILADLDFAEENLPASRTNSINRAVKGAAIALKTRVKLHMGDWPGVIAEAKKLGVDPQSATLVSPINGYKLEADVKTPFRSYTNNGESIFSVAQSTLANAGVNGSLGSMLAPSLINGRNLISVSPNFYNASFWAPGDKRKNDLFIVNWNAATKVGDSLVFVNKYIDPVNREEWAPIIRYAEVVLNASEAYFKNGNATGAFALLNKVRNRSVPESEQYTSAPSDLYKAILNERRMEFFAEGRRWPDIHRLALDPDYGIAGIPAKIGPSVAPMRTAFRTKSLMEPTFKLIPYSDFRFLWPIPIEEINNNPTLKKEQNPGY